MQSFNQIITEGKPVLVEFYASWCGACKLMKPVMKSADRKLGSSIRIIKIDVDNNPLLVAKYHVRNIPALLLFHKGKLLWKEDRIIPSGKLIGKIEEAINIIYGLPHINSSKQQKQIALI